MEELKDIDFQKAISGYTLVARLVDSQDLRGLPGNKIDVLIDGELHFKGFVLVPVLPLIRDADEGIFYILPDRSIWYNDNGVWAQPTAEAIAKIVEAIEVNNPIGKIYDGTTIPEGTEQEEILRKMLHKCDVPEIEEAGVKGLHIFVPGAAATDIRIEDDYIVAPGVVVKENSELNIMKDLGTIDPDYGTSGTRVNDDFTKYTFIGDIIPGGSVDMPDSTPVVMPNDYSMAHGESTEVTLQLEVGTSDQPKDAEGDDYLKPIPTGTILEKTVKIHCRKPFYSNAGEESVRPYQANWKACPSLPETPDETKHVLKYVRTGLPENTNECYFWFAVPNEYTLQHVYILDENTGELMPADDIIVLDNISSHQIGGHKVYHDVREIQLGERTVVIEYENNL